MIKYYDRNTNSFHTKSDTSKDVFLVIDGNKFTAISGLKPMYDGTYSLNNDDITFNTVNYYIGILTHDIWTDMFSWTHSSLFTAVDFSLQTFNTGTSLTKSDQD